MLSARPSRVPPKTSRLLGHIIVLRVEHHMLLLPIAYELVESRVVCDVNTPSFRTATCSSANYEERYEHTMAVAGFLDTAGYDDYFGLFRQCLLTSKLQSYRFRRSARWVFRLHHGPQ